MSEPILITDDTLENLLDDSRPIFILFTNGDGLRGDFKVAYNKAAQEDNRFVFAKIDPTKSPKAAERFNVGEKAVLVGVLDGEEVLRRQRPWGTDLPLAFEQMQNTLKDRNPDVVTAVATKAESKPAPAPAPAATAAAMVHTKPVAVTDATFEQEVLNSEIPVLVDFWAEWCGPCRMVGPILDKLAGEFAGQIKIAKVDVDANPGLSQAFQIMSIPNLMIVKQRTIIFNQPGALPEAALRDLIRQAIALQIPPQEQQQKQPVKQ